MLYFDCSHLQQFLNHGRPLTGIQRVTLNSLIGAWKKLGSNGVKVVTYDKTAKLFLTLEVEELLKVHGRGEISKRICHFQDSDTVILTEYLWDATVAAATVKRTNFGQARIVRLIYDVIPLAMPKLCPRSWVRKFRNFISNCIKNADCVMTISDFSKSDIQKYFANECAGKFITVLKLPHEFTGVQKILEGAGFDSKQGASRAAISSPPSILEKQSFVLIVGTVDERKNQLVAVRAWQKLHAKHGAKLPKLVLVGGLTSHSFLFKAKMRYALRQQDIFIHLNKCDDDGLRWLYENCLFSVFLSNYEGWGLPVGESLWFGKPVISARTTSLPEVGEDYVDYVDPNNEAALLAKIEQLCFDNDYRQFRADGIAHRKLRTWNEFSNNLLGSV